jgi:hypothetical protein
MHATANTLCLPAVGLSRAVPLPVCGSWAGPGRAGKGVAVTLHVEVRFSADLWHGMSTSRLVRLRPRPTLALTVIRQYASKTCARLTVIDPSLRLSAVDFHTQVSSESQGHPPPLLGDSRHGSASERNSLVTSGVRPVAACQIQ